ncbi:hypothetical protein ACSVC9_10540 [Clostridium sp. LBM24168]
MLEKTQIKIIAVPYKNFRQKVRIIKKFEKRYHIEDLAGDAAYGVLYMERKDRNAGVN